MALRFIGMMRVKNEARWIERVIRSLLPLCERVYILDDHSTDETPEIASSFPEAIVFDSPFDTMHETRDKTWLLKQIVNSGEDADYVIHVDGDEELEPGAQSKLPPLLRGGRYDAASFRVKYLWNEPRIWRTDGVYSDFKRPSLFRLNPLIVDFASGSKGNQTLHCSNVPAAYIPRTRVVDINLLHWGYFDQQTRVRKYEFYNRIDPNNEAEDCYRHMVIGDIFPPESRFKHAGPLSLARIRY